MKISTLLIFSPGGSRRDIFIQTYLQSLVSKIDNSLHKINKASNTKLQKVISSLINPYESLSYINDWIDAFVKHKSLDVTLLNIANRNHANKILNQNINDFELIIFSHSVMGDNIELISPFQDQILTRKAKLISFIGNEYDLIPEKKKVLKDFKVDYLASQLPKDAMDFLYSEFPNRISAPHALNESLYCPPKTHKIYDFVFNGAKFGKFIGDEDRTKIINKISALTSHCHNKINIGKNVNLQRHLWINLLQKGKATIGAESGTNFLDKNGILIQRAKTYEIDNPGCSLDEIINNVYRNCELEFISGKAMSSRHMEPIGTKTCQILLEGDYNGILKPNEHYIQIKKDFSNVGDALEIYFNDSKRHEIIEKAFTFALENHTYKHRIDSILDKIEL
ncbi:MAG: hypothetical protein ACPH4N_02220 [Flavobacteriaceae bacterium]